MKIITNGKNIDIIEKEKLYTGNVKTYIIEIEFEESNRLLEYSCYVTFKNGDVKKKVIVGPNQKIHIPHEVLENVGDLVIGFFATKEDNERKLIRYSSDIYVLPVQYGGYDEDAEYTEEINPSILEQYLQEMRDFYNESLKEYNVNAENKLNNYNDNASQKLTEYNSNSEDKLKEYNNNALNKIEDYNTNAKLKKEEIDAVAKEVTQNKTDIEQIEKRVSASESNAKASETNAKTSESNAQKSAENASEILTNVTTIQEDINKSKEEINIAKESVDKSVEEVNVALTEATNQAKESEKQAGIATEKANQTSADRTAVENAKNDVSSMKTSVEQTKTDTEQIKTDAQGIYNNTVDIKNETLEAKGTVEKSLENERIESDKKYARAIETDEIVVDGSGQVELDEDGYMKEFYAEGNLPEITQKKVEAINIPNSNFEIGSISSSNGNENSVNTRLRSKYIEIEEGKSDIIKFEASGNGIDMIGILQYDKDKKYIGTTDWQPIPYIYKIDDRVTYVRVVIKNYGNTEIILSDLKSFKMYYGESVSPSMDYPSPFENLIKNIDISNCQRNFLDMSKAKDGSSGGITVTLNDDGTYSYVGTATQIAINIWFLGSFNNTKPIFTLKAGTYYIKDVILYNEHERLNDNESLITFAEDTKITGVRAAQAFVGQTYNEIKTPMIVRTESTEVSFEPYNGYNENLALSENQFLGNFQGYKNYIKDDKLKGRLKILTLTGNEDWEQNQKAFFFRNSKFVKSSSLCTHFVNAGNEWTSDNENLRGKYTLTNVVGQFKCMPLENMTLDEWKAKVKELYDSGNPLQVLYITAEEFEEDLTAENKSKINNLKVYKGINNIYSNCKIRFKANKNINNHIEKRLEEVKDIERNISDDKYAKALKDKVEDKQFAKIYTENPEVKNLVIKGNEITQKTRNGYNKYNKNTSVVGKIDATGVVNSAIYDWETSDFIEIEELLEYLLSWKSTSSFFQVTLAYFNSDKELIDRIDIQQHNLYKYTFSTPENTSYLRFSYSKVVNSVSANRTEIQLVEGTEEKSYEEYGTSPSLNHPSEIKVITEQNINVSKGNLLNVTIEDVTKSGVKAINNGDGSVNIKGISTETSKNISFDLGTIELKKGESISVKPYGLEGLSTDIRFLTLVNAGVSTLIDFRAKDFATYTASEDVTGTFRFYVKPGQNVDVTIKVMAVKGLKTVEEMPEFRKYQSKDYKVALLEGKFTGKFEGFENNIKDDKLKCYLKIYTFTGDENLRVSEQNPSDYNRFFYDASLPINQNNLSSFCNYSSYKNDYNLNNEHFYINSNGRIYLFENKEKYPDVESIKNKLKELYESGNPLQVLYIASEEFEEDLPEGTVPKIELMDDLNILSIDNGTFSLEYNKSISRAFEEERENNANLQAQIDEIKALLSTPSTASLLAENLAKDNESEVI